MDALTFSGIARETATLAVAMWSRKHIRPENELLDQVANYPSLETIGRRLTALQDARNRSWVIETPSKYGGRPMVQAAPELGMMLASIAPHCQDEILRLPRSHHGVQILGHMGSREVYDSFSTRLSEAQSDIALPMVMTSPQLSAIEVLKSRADSGVRIRVLLATAELAAEIRGGHLASEARERLGLWRLHSKGRRRFQVKVSRHRVDLRDASSALIDGRSLRYDVYDDTSERSIDGVMITIARSEPTNLSRMFQDRFDEAWRRARPLGFWPSAGWAVRRWWWWGLVAVSTAIVAEIHVEHPTATGLLLGAVAGYLVNHIDSLGDRIHKWWNRRRT